MEFIAAFSAGYEVEDDPRCQKFVIHVGADEVVNGLGELLLLVLWWSEWSLRMGSGAIRGGISCVTATTLI